MNKFRIFVLIMAYTLFIPAVAVQSQPEGGSFDGGNFARLKNERVLFHPALYRNDSESQFDVYFSRPYGLRELDTRCLLLMLPWGKNRIALSITSFGGKLYSETGVSSISLLPVATGLWVSSELKWLQVTVSGYGGMSDFSMTQGVFYEISRYDLGFRLLNIISCGDAHSRAGRSRAFQFRAGTSLSPAFKIAVGMFHETGFPAVWILENRIFLGKVLGLVVEIGVNPSQYTFGIEIKQRALQFVYHLKQHSDLGSTSQLGVSYRFAAKRQR